MISFIDNRSHVAELLVNKKLGTKRLQPVYSEWKNGGYQRTTTLIISIQILDRI